MSTAGKRKYLFIDAKFISCWQHFVSNHSWSNLRCGVYDGLMILNLCKQILRALSVLFKLAYLATSYIESIFNASNELLCISFIGVVEMIRNCYYHYHLFIQNNASVLHYIWYRIHWLINLLIWFEFKWRILGFKNCLNSIKKQRTVKCKLQKTLDRLIQLKLHDHICPNIYFPHFLS